MEQLIDGRYRLERVLGRGGMGVVHSAWDTKLARRVAIKQLHAVVAEDPQLLRRFQREAQSVAALHHPNIVVLYDSGEAITDGPDGPRRRPYLVMEHLEGRTLAEQLTTGPLPEPTVLVVMRGLLQALECARERGLVHRDVKAGNVMLTDAGEVKLLDLGIARNLDETTGMTHTGVLVGTASSMAPEQAMGQPVDHRSDLYSAGCVLYQLLTGQSPFLGDSPLAVVHQHVSAPVRPPSQVRPGLDPVWNGVVVRALAKQPDQRFQTAAEMLAAVQAAAGSASPAPIPEGVPANRSTVDLGLSSITLGSRTNGSRTTGSRTTTLPALSGAPAPVQRPSRRRGMVALWAAAVATVALVIGLLGWRMASDAVPKGTTTSASSARTTSTASSAVTQQAVTSGSAATSTGSASTVTGGATNTNLLHAAFAVPSGWETDALGQALATADLATFRAPAKTVRKPVNIRYDQLTGPVAKTQWEPQFETELEVAKRDILSHKDFCTNGRYSVTTPQHRITVNNMTAIRYSYTCDDAHGPQIVGLMQISVDQAGYFHRLYTACDASTYARYRAQVDAMVNSMRSR